MGNVTLHIPDQLHDRMKAYKELKWTQIIRELIEMKVKQLEEGELRLLTLQRLKQHESAEDLFDF